MPEVTDYLSGLPAFLLYLIAAAAMVVFYATVYMRMTGHDELKLIRANVPAAALAFAGSLIGFSLPLASAIAHSVGIVDCILWGLIALVVQIVAYLAVRLTIKDISTRIENNEIAAAGFLAAVSLTAGLLNAASMTY